MSTDLYTMRIFPEKFGLDTQRVRVWLKEKYIAASHESDGQGRKAYFTKSDLYRVALFVKLLEKGFKRELAGEYLNSLKKKPTELVDKTPYLLFINDKKEQDDITGPHSFFGVEMKITIGPDFVDIGDFGKEQSKHDWEDILVVNYAKIRGGVDELLKN